MLMKMKFSYSLFTKPSTLVYSFEISTERKRHVFALPETSLYKRACPINFIKPVFNFRPCLLRLRNVLAMAAVCHIRLARQDNTSMPYA